LESHEQWAGIAEEWIRWVNGPKDPHRDGLLDAWMLDAVGDVSGIRVIDLGCGEGRFGRMLAERGAEVVGIDFMPLFVEHANAHRVGSETCLVGDMSDLSRFEDASFDLAVSYVTLVDVRDFRPVVREAYRMLRPGGRFVIANLQPMATAGNGWLKDEQRNKLHFKLDNYFDEGGPREMPMCGGVVINYHHSLSAYINSFLEAGFRLQGIREPMPSPEQLERFPELSDNLRVAYFIIYLLRKDAP
jgi:ubiquinone/menaquinone biosynthesis C-methylase UbiE